MEEVSSPPPGRREPAGGISEVQAREPRRRELARIPKFKLAQMCRAGITRRRDGGISYVEGGYAPVIEWTRDEIVQAILNAEFG